VCYSNEYQPTNLLQSGILSHQSLWFGLKALLRLLSTAKGDTRSLVASRVWNFLSITLSKNLASFTAELDPAERALPSWQS
jgi:hypothetical protein